VKKSENFDFSIGKNQNTAQNKTGKTCFLDFAGYKLL
jgi:hypothetical protein